MRATRQAMAAVERKLVSINVASRYHLAAIEMPMTALMTASARQRPLTRTILIDDNRAIEC